MQKFFVKEDYAHRVPNVTYLRGTKWQRGEYQTHHRHGRWLTWHHNGVKASEGRYEHGKRIGSWTFWSDLGQKVCEVEFVSNSPHFSSVM